MPKPFTTIVPPSFKAASETYQYSPAVRIGDQILISGIVGADADGQLPPDFRSQAENAFSTLEAILNEVGATLDDVASLNSHHVGDIHGGSVGMPVARLTDCRKPAGIQGDPPLPKQSSGRLVGNTNSINPEKNPHSWELFPKNWCVKE